MTRVAVKKAENGVERYLHAFRAPVRSIAQKGNTSMLAIIGLLLIALWVLGLVVHIAGGFIHLVLLVAVIFFVLHFLSGGKSAA